VSLAPLRAGFDDVVRQIQAALLGSLRQSTVADLTQLCDFVSQSLDILQQTPQTIEDIAACTQKTIEISRQVDSERIRRRRLDDKVKLLKTMGQPLDATTVGAFVQQWDDLELRVGAHEKVVNEQKDKLRDLIAAKVKSVEGDVTRFSSRWAENKPKGVNMSDSKAAMQTLANLKVSAPLESD
jgi:hypothetical protein